MKPKTSSQGDEGTQLPPQSSMLVAWLSSYTQVIGLVLPDDSDAFYQNPFFPSVLRGIAQVASENHYAIQIATGKDEKSGSKLFPDGLW